MTLRLLSLLLVLLAVPAARAQAQPAPRAVRVGIIGLDTSHSTAFTKLLNAETPDSALAGYRVTAAYPHGSADIPSSVSRIPGYTEEVRKLGVEVVESVDELLARVDVVLLETNDGRPHLEQARQVIEAGKPLFIDKPVAASLTDVVAIYDLAARRGVPVFSSSSLRFMESALAARAGQLGPVLGADAFSPAWLEPTHPDLFWYGIHGVETLYTVMGTGCETVTRAATDSADVVVGVWKDGRIGTFRGLRAGRPGYGGTVFTAGGASPIGPYHGYRPLVVEIIRFFRTGVAPVSPEETLEIYAFMEAAHESRRRGGVPVRLDETLARARAAAPR